MSLNPTLLLLVVVNLALAAEGVTVLLGGTDTMHMDRPQDSSVLDAAEVLTCSVLVFSMHPLPPEHLCLRRLSPESRLA